MLHLAFNYHDPLVQLRLAALLAIAAAITCLSAFEFMKKPSLVFRLFLGLALVACCTAVGYVLMKLKGA